MFDAPTRVAERWKSMKFSEFERRQLSAAKKELDQEYEAQVDLSLKASKGAQQRSDLTDLVAQWRSVNTTESAAWICSFERVC